MNKNIPGGEFSATGRGNERKVYIYIYTKGVHFQKRDPISEVYFFFVCAVDHTQTSLAVAWKCSYRDVITC